MPITEYLERNRKLYGDEVALVELNPEQPDTCRTTWKEYSLIQPAVNAPYRREITWRVFDEKANRCANLLLSRGVGRGDKVAILMMNCLEWLPIYFGILKAGAIAVPFNFRYSTDEIQYCLDLAEVDVLLFGPEFIGRLEPIADGTTGFPKAILHKHRALMHAALVEQKHHGTSREDCFLCIPPLYHTGAKMHWFGSLVAGSRAVLLRGTKPEYIFSAVSREHCTIVWLLVPWAQDILDALDSGSLRMEDYDIGQWRLMHIGAQPVPPSLVRHWMEYFPHHQYDTNYGLSESIGPGCVHLGVENVRKVGAIGVAGYGWEVRIVDDEGNPVKQGEAGELCVRGDGVMVCYYRNPEATREVLTEDGWLKTGDVAREDEEGFIYLIDRKKDVIVSGGENLYPVQIEDFLRRFDKIHDVAVIGLPDSRLGEIAGAVISIKEGMTCTEEEILEFCKGMPKYKRPRKIIFADVPRNPTGKIEKPLLRKTYGEEFLVAYENNK